ncbi:MAG: hypothetical protein WBF17_07305, partial [Phycisphaerae bacterium]
MRGMRATWARGGPILEVLETRLLLSHVTVLSPEVAPADEAFGAVKQELDFGDAPDDPRVQAYPTLLAH